MDTLRNRVHLWGHLTPSSYDRKLENHWPEVWKATGLALYFVQIHTHTVYPHASLPCMAVWSHTLSQDPDFTQPIHCVSANNPPLSLPLKGWGWWGEERAEGKKERIPSCLVQQCCLFFPAVSGQWTTSASLSPQPSLPTDCFIKHGPLALSCSVTHTMSDSQECVFFFFFAPPVNGLSNL